MSCGNNCNCGDKCSCNTVSNKISTDGIKLRNIANVVYMNVNENSIHNFEILHFELYFLCNECGYTQKFEKDETPYHAIKFMANYPCISCGCTNGFSGFMIRVSPDRGIKYDGNAVTHDQFLAALMSLESMSDCNKFVGNA